MKVVASDAPAHTDADTLTGERVSGEFVVDTTPPVPGRVHGDGWRQAKIHATFEAKDATSPIAHAEYSVDAGPWQIWSRWITSRTRLKSGMTSGGDPERQPRQSRMHGSM